MNVYKNIDNLPIFENAVITIGTFDGVHLGHKQIIRQLLEEAAKVNGSAVLITFYPHPKLIVSAERKPIFILNSPDEKYRLLHDAGIENIVVVPFNTDFAGQPAINYIRDFLVAKFHPHTIIIGYDHRFGKNREGNYQLLEQESKAFNYSVKEIPEHILEDVKISSTRIREALLSGEIMAANNLLGYRYFFTGTVTEGNKLGRTIGYPTANLLIEDQEKLVPGNGVYAVDVEITNVAGIFKAMMNIGIRPTVDGSKRVIEVNIFDFNEIIYDAEITVFLKEKLRDEIKFNGLEELKLQLAKDKTAAILL